MKKYLIWLLTGLATLGAFACNDDDGYSAPDAVREALKNRYPDAEHVTWKSKNGYAVADFDRPDNRLPRGRSDCKAWFSPAGTWYMTEQEIAFEALPEAVRTAFAATEYASWRIDETERFERDGLETLYVIECELRDTEVELYYTADGRLFRTVVDADDRDDFEQLLPGTLPNGVAAYIATHYPAARILEIDRKGSTGAIEVEILDGTKLRELYFVADKWVRTETEIGLDELPAPVLAAIGRSEYASWAIEETDFVEEPTRSFYLIELELGPREAKLRIDPAGNILA